MKQRQKNNPTKRQIFKESYRDIDIETKEHTNIETQGQTD